MAGRDAGFDARVFRDAIKFVYEMAAAPLPDEQVAFYRPSQLVYAAPTDDDNTPFDPATTVQRVVPEPVRVPCGLEYVDADGQQVPFGTVTASRIVTSLLDEEYVQVKDSSYVVIGGERYLYQRTEPPTGLFDVGIYRMTWRAENEI